MIKEECRKFFESNFDFWDRLTDEEREVLCISTTLKDYRKGERVNDGGNECKGLIAIKKGELRVYMLSEDGREITLYRLRGGDVCILSASCVLDEITFDVFIDAEEDTEVYLVNSAAFKRLSEENIYVKCYAYESATEKFSHVMWAMQQILFMSIDRRLAVFLLEESENRGSDSLKITHEQIARYVGSAREVISRMLKYFEAEGVVKLSRGTVKITDREKLEELAGN